MCLYTERCVRTWFDILIILFLVYSCACVRVLRSWVNFSLRKILTWYQSYTKFLHFWTNLKKKLPHNRLWPRVGIYIANFHRINVPNAMVRSNLMLDTPNFCDTPELGCGDEARWWSQTALWRGILQELWYHVRIFPRERFNPRP